MTSTIRPYQAVYTADSLVFHYWDGYDGHEMTLCGRLNPEGGFTLGQGDRRLCHTCHRIAVARLHPAMPSERVVTAAEALVPRLVEHDDARVWECAGESGVYLVVILPGMSVCTCMAGKTNPTVLCKHQTAAFLAMAREKVEAWAEAGGLEGVA